MCRDQVLQQVLIILNRLRYQLFEVTSALRVSNQHETPAIIVVSHIMLKTVENIGVGY